MKTKVWVVVEINTFYHVQSNVLEGIDVGSEAVTKGQLFWVRRHCQFDLDF